MRSALGDVPEAVSRVVLAVGLTNWVAAEIVLVDLEAGSVENWMEDMRRGQHWTRCEEDVATLTKVLSLPCSIPRLHTGARKLRFARHVPLDVDTARVLGKTLLALLVSWPRDVASRTGRGVFRRRGVKVAH